MALRIARLLLLISLVGSLSAAAAPDPGSVNCAMIPAHVRMPLPPSGLTWVEGEDLSGPCEKVPAGQWTTAHAKAGKVMVHADGPVGSGRFWTVTVGLASKTGTKPDRGVCLTTSTVGWRTLQVYKRTPLPWLADLDDDGAAEVLIWDSFPLSDDPSEAEYALVAWVYGPDAEGTFTLDWALSRQMAAELAEAYASPMPEGARWADVLRKKASEQLEAFAYGRCLPGPTNAR
ncbi:MAG: hypothetical protein ACREKR_02180 [Candidatus Methylomirabilales bacterium]